MKKKVIGQWFAKQAENWGDDGSVLEANDIVWDTYFLYGSDASWESTPGRPLSWGATIVGEQEKLKSSIAPLLETK